MSEDESRRVGTSAASTGSSGGATFRVFCAVELPEEIRAAVAAHASRLRRECPDARASWARPEGLHLTLKFVGEVEAPRVQALSRAAEAAAKGFSPFRLSIEGPG
ncbi:MAG TPA: 2'-5' RNA ligase family protein, partial [Pyrinomonadaceae bacterium]